ncbi:hypothetical protein HMI54_008598 [Coelomomyces lativittatus]|nr:hypothetical protein HMI54_008598 [Coelomomyces lativittatus]
MSEPNSYSTSIHHSPMRSEIPLSVLLHPNADSSSLSLHLPTSSTSAPDSTSDFMPSSPSLSPSLYHHSLSLNSSCSSPSFPLCIPPHTSSIQGSQGGSFTSLVTPRPFYVFNRASYDLMLQCLVKGTSPKLKEIMEADPQQGLPTKRWKRLQGNLKIYNAPDDPLHPKLVWKSCFQNLIIEPIEEWIHIFHKIHTHKNERNQVRHLRIQKCLEMLTRQYQYRRSRCGFTMEDFRRFYTECSCQT